MWGPFDTAMFGMFIGLVSAVAFFAAIIVIVVVIIRHRKERAEMLHKERMMALEKGLPVPTDVLEPPRKKRPYVTGLVWAGIGVAIVLWGIIEQEDDLNAWGLVPLFVGIALIIGDALAARRSGNGS